MDKREEELIRKLKELMKAPMQCEPATVKTVDEDELTCSVELADGTELNDVRLKAAIDGVKDGAVQIPEVESTVIIGRIGNDSNTRFVLLFSKVTKVLFYGGEKSELVIWEGKLKTELDKVKSMLTHLVGVINGAPVAEPGSGAPSALQTALNASIAGDQLPNFEDLTDDKVLH